MPRDANRLIYATGEFTWIFHHVFFAESSLLSWGSWQPQKTNSVVNNILMLVAALKLHLSGECQEKLNEIFACQTNERAIERTKTSTPIVWLLLRVLASHSNEISIGTTAGPSPKLRLKYWSSIVVQLQKGNTRRNCREMQCALGHHKRQV